jgi:hypothetical protein
MRRILLVTVALHAVAPTAPALAQDAAEVVVRLNRWRGRCGRCPGRSSSSSSRTGS